MKTVQAKHISLDAIIFFTGVYSDITDKIMANRFSPYVWPPYPYELMAEFMGIPKKLAFYAYSTKQTHDFFNEASKDHVGYLTEEGKARYQYLKTQPVNTFCTLGGVNEV